MKYFLKNTSIVHQQKMLSHNQEITKKGFLCEDFKNFL